MAKEIKQWITVNHIHIPIFEGESKADAVKRLKQGVRKGKENRPISKESYDKKKSSAEKARKALSSHTERLVKAEDAIKSGDTSGKAKKERMNAERTLKEAGQRLVKREAEYDKANKHLTYSSIKVKNFKKEKDTQKEDFVVDYKIPDKLPTKKKPSASAQRKALMKQYLQSHSMPENTPKTQTEAKQMYSEMKKTTVDHVQSKSSHSLANDLKAKGFELDSADRHTIENSRTFNDEKVTLFDKDNNEYEGTFNKYSDGGAEIVNIRRKANSPKVSDSTDNRKTLSKYHEQEAQQRQALSDYEDSWEYRQLYGEDRKNDTKKKELESALENTRAKSRELVAQMQSKGELPKYSEKGDGKSVITNATVEADPRYNQLRESLPYKKYQASDMLRHIMYAEEEGRNSFTTTVYDFYAGDKDYLGKYKPGGYATFGEYLRTYKKAYKDLGWKVETSKDSSVHQHGYMSVKGKRVYASTTGARTLTFTKMEPKPTKQNKSWQDKDEEIKAKQIAKAEKDKSELNKISKGYINGGTPKGWYANSNERDEFLKAMKEEADIPAKKNTSKAKEDFNFEFAPDNKKSWRKTSEILEEYEKVTHYIDAYNDGVDMGKNIEELKEKERKLSKELKETKAHERQLAGLKKKNSYKK